MGRSSFSDDSAVSREPYGYSKSSARDSKHSLRPTVRGHDSSSSSSSSTRRKSKDRSEKPSTSRKMPRKRKSTGGTKDADPAADTDTDTAAISSIANVANGLSVSPTAIFNNLQSAWGAFQSLPSLSAAVPAPAQGPGGGVAGMFSTTASSIELNIPNTPVTNLLNPQYLRLPPSQAVLHSRLAANLPRHGNAYAVLLVGTLLTSHWLVLAALFGVVKFGLFLQGYNGRDIARDLGVRKYASSQAVMSGFAAATVFVGLWAFSSVFSVVFTLVKVACLVLLHAAFFEGDDQHQHQHQQYQKPQLQQRVIGNLSPASASSTSLASAPPPPPQGVLRPAGSSMSLSPRDAATFAQPPPPQQMRSASDGHPSATYSNGWYAGDGYVGGREDEYAVMPRTPRSYDQYPPSPRRDEYGAPDGNGSWGGPPAGYYESGRPQSYASGRSY
ncbi:hypothetical protein CPLU01_10298 [Colletotrichum plurivorum]|uniref:Prenylated Rab acceptor 1 n=1 Tax=Colletotrichum plurivorum TaxID=2175906 RepID=A0A8H6K639_9PEZI|nr:hypothetical protein CPLU01_10298 [Colletotrichum plurivorum]